MQYLTKYLFLLVCILLSAFDKSTDRPQQTQPKGKTDQNLGQERTQTRDRHDFLKSASKEEEKYSSQCFAQGSIFTRLSFDFHVILTDDASKQSWVLLKEWQKNKATSQHVIHRAKVKYGNPFGAFMFYTPKSEKDITAQLQRGAAVLFTARHEANKVIFQSTSGYGHTARKVSMSRTLTEMLLTKEYNKDNNKNVGKIKELIETLPLTVSFMPAKTACTLTTLVEGITCFSAFKEFKLEKEKIQDLRQAFEKEGIFLVSLEDALKPSVNMHALPLLQWSMKQKMLKPDLWKKLGWTGTNEFLTTAFAGVNDNIKTLYHETGLFELVEKEAILQRDNLTKLYKSFQPEDKNPMQSFYMKLDATDKSSSQPYLLFLFLSGVVCGIGICGCAGFASKYLSRAATRVAAP